MTWRSVSPARVDAALERAQERALSRYEAEQDRLEAEHDEREAEAEDFPARAV